MPGGLLDIWVIYEHPTDQPDFYVVRRQWATEDGEVHKDRRAYGFRDLERARLFLAEKGLTCLPRFPEDDPVIVETWL